MTNRLDLLLSPLHDSRFRYLIFVDSFLLPHCFPFHSSQFSCVLCMGPAQSQVCDYTLVASNSKHYESPEFTRPVWSLSSVIGDPQYGCVSSIFFFLFLLPLSSS